MVRTRFAPSPTGFIHIGSIRTALYSYALAKKHNGKFILRIEDTDKSREIEKGVKDIVENVKIFGIKPDEGPSVGGSHKPYIQSQRLDIYKEKAEELVNKGKAYYCFCKKERLEKLKENQQRKGKQPRYDEKCRNIDLHKAKERVHKGEPYVIRLKVPKNRRLKIEDALLGKISWNSNDVDDQVLLKSDGFPTYHLAVVVDDVIMEISHITRGIEWLASVPKHVLLYEAFEYKFPITAHMPVILDPEGGKLSKRKGTVSVREFLELGYLPEALLNFLMLLGWAPNDDREIYSLKEFVKEFSLERLNKASPVFDRKKLLWFNGEYIRKYSKKLFTSKVLDWTQKYCKNDEMKKYIKDDKDLLKKLELIQERISILSDVIPALEFFYKKPFNANPKEIKGTKNYSLESYKQIAGDYLGMMQSYSYKTKEWKHEVWEKDIRFLADKYKWKHRDVFMLIRLIVCGNPVSPPLFESMVILGKDEIVDRIKSFM